jgi:hypothetical protein
LLKKYSDTPFVFISSEYAIKPVNLYSATKTVGELLTYAYAKSHLIIRTLFKPRPYPFNVAFSDQYTRGDYIDIIGRLIAEEIKNWDKETKVLKVSIVAGDFFPGEVITGTISSAIYSVKNFDRRDLYDKYSQNVEIEIEADSILDFSESNPFGNY